MKKSSTKQSCFMYFLADFLKNGNIPSGSILDILSWETVYTGKSCQSFYNTQKNFINHSNKDNTIRISGHWDDKAIANKWAMCQYDSVLGTYIIKKVYDENYDNISELKKKLKEKVLESRHDKYPKDFIEKRREFKKMMIENLVTYKEGDRIGFVKKIGNRGNAHPRKCMDVIVSGEKEFVYLDEGRNIIVEFENKIYTTEQLRLEGYF